MPSARMSLNRRRVLLPAWYVRNRSLRRLAFRGAVVRVRRTAYDEMRLELSDFLRRVLRLAIIVQEHCRRNTLSEEDVHYALRLLGMRLYR